MKFVVMFRRSSKEKFWTMHGVTWDSAEDLIGKILQLTLETDLEIHIKRLPEEKLEGYK